MNIDKQLIEKVQSRIKASKEKREIRVREEKRAKGKEVEERSEKAPTTPEERLALIKERAIKRKRLEESMNMDLDDVVVPPRIPTPASKKSAVPPTVDYHHRGGWQAEQPTAKPRSRRPAVFLKQSAPASGRTTKVLETPIAPREVRRAAIRSIQEHVKTKITMIVPATSTSTEDEAPMPRPIQPGPPALECTPTPIQQLESTPSIIPKTEFPLGPTLILRPVRHYKKKGKKKRYLEQGDDGKIYQVEERGGRVIRTEKPSKKVPSTPSLKEAKEVPTSTT